MTTWLIILVGLVIGWLIGYVIISQNHATCRQQTETLEATLAETDAALEKASQERDRLAHAIQQKEAELKAIG